MYHSKSPVIFPKVAGASLCRTAYTFVVYEAKNVSCPDISQTRAKDLGRCPRKGPGPMLDISVQHLFSKSEMRMKEMLIDHNTRLLNANKRHRAVLAVWVEELATALALEWLIEHAEEIAVFLSEPTKPVEVMPSAPKPDLRAPLPYEVCRALERRARRRVS